MPPPVIYVDVDDTLVRSFGSKRIPIARAIGVVRELSASGAELYCWSSGGGEYARATCAELGLLECFRAFLPKPQVLVDDAWKVDVVHPNSAVAGDLIRRRL